MSNGVSRGRRLSRTPLTIMAATVFAGFVFAAAAQAAAPVKFNLVSHLGQEVDGVTKGNVCTVESGHECVAGAPSAQPGGFEIPLGIAVDAKGDVYVADVLNHRVQELTANGEFVLMFGKEVNETKVNAVKAKGGTSTAAELEEENLCTEAEVKTLAVKCQAGKSGSASGAFSDGNGLAFDPSTQLIFVRDMGNSNKRVDEYTAAGRFVLMVGKGVNKTKDETPGATTIEKNVCTAASGDTCTAGTERSSESSEEDAFFETPGADFLTASSGVLYVADQQRVAKIGTEGQWLGEIQVPPSMQTAERGGSISDIAAGGGKVYLVYTGSAGEPGEVTVHEFEAGGSELPGQIVVGTPGKGHITHLAFGGTGQLVVGGYDGNVAGGNEVVQFGLLYNAVEGHLVTRFSFPGNRTSQILAVGLDGQGDLYASVGLHNEVLRYQLVPVAELLTKQATCQAGAEIDTSVTFNCTLNGEVNPYDVPGTEVWFEWGGSTCEFGSLTANQPIATVEELRKVSAALVGLPPGKTVCYQLTGDDHNAPRSESLVGGQASLTTPVAAPKTVGVPRASFVNPFSAVMYGELNPEDEATEYFFEYAPEGEAGEDPLIPCAGVTASVGCPGVSVTNVLDSEIYGRIGATQQALDLRSSTTYHYRLTVRREGGKPALSTGVEGTFTTPQVLTEEVPAPLEPVLVEVPAVLQAPAPVMLLATPAISFPKIGAPKPRAKCRSGYTRNARNACVKLKRKPGKARKKTKKAG